MKELTERHFDANKWKCKKKKKKSFGFGSNIVNEKCIFHLWSVPCMRKSGEKRNQSCEGTTVFLCLLLSGDTHQCQRSLGFNKLYLDVLSAGGKEDRRSGITVILAKIVRI